MVRKKLVCDNCTLEVLEDGETFKEKAAHACWLDQKRGVSKIVGFRSEGHLVRPDCVDDPRVNREDAFVGSDAGVKIVYKPVGHRSVTYRPIRYRAVVYKPVGEKNPKRLSFPERTPII
jgi:hypothetical protein